jgi:hypothetical protein
MTHHDETAPPVGMYGVEPRFIAAARLFVCHVTPGWGADLRCQEELAWAIHYQKPIRVLLAPGMTFPDLAFAGIADLAWTQSTGDDEADAAQTQAWLAALPPKGDVHA